MTVACPRRLIFVAPALRPFLLRLRGNRRRFVCLSPSFREHCVISPPPVYMRCVVLPLELVFSVAAALSTRRHLCHPFVSFSLLLRRRYSSTTQYNPLERNFHLPLSGVDADQLVCLNALVQSHNLPSQQNDQWYYIWGTTSFASKQAYIVLSGSLTASPLWECLNP
jgi:hypothetical protein